MNYIGDRSHFIRECHDTQHNNIQHNDTQHYHTRRKRLFATLSINDTLHYDPQNNSIEHHNADCWYAESHYAEYCNAECRGAHSSKQGNGAEHSENYKQLLEYQIFLYLDIWWSKFYSIFKYFSVFQQQY